MGDPVCAKQSNSLSDAARPEASAELSIHQSGVNSAGRGWRVPIYVQMLLPIVTLATAAVVVSAAATAGWLAIRARNEQREMIHRLTTALSEARFPLTTHVLTQLREFTGAEFVLFDEGGRLVASTWAVDDADRQRAIEMLVRTSHPPQIIQLPTERHATSRAIGDEYFVERASLDSVGSPNRGLLFVLYPQQRITRRMLSAGLPALVVGAAAVLMSMAAAAWLARRMVRPIYVIRQHAARIAQGDFVPIAIKRPNDELRDLCETINRMAVQLSQYEAQVRRNERMQTLGRLGAALAHQLRNAAAGSRLAIELHMRSCSAGGESLVVALRQLAIIETYLQRFLRLERIAPPCATAIDIRRVINDALDLLRPTIEHRGVVVEVVVPEGPVCLRADREAVRQLVVNLTGNAIDAASEIGKGVGKVRLLLTCAGGAATLAVEDNGVGPDASVVERLFEPFVSGKTEGIGLGLWVARQIAEAYGGTLDWRRCGDRTVFEFRFATATETAVPGENLSNEAAERE